jgi:hypothetical protein
MNPHLWQLKTTVFLHRCLIRSVLLWKSIRVAEATCHWSIRSLHTDHWQKVTLFTGIRLLSNDSSDSGVPLDARQPGILDGQRVWRRERGNAPSQRRWHRARKFRGSTPRPRPWSWRWQWLIICPSTASFRGSFTPPTKTGLFCSPIRF